MSEQQPPRPPRSLRDRTGARKLENSELPPSDYIQKKTIEKPADFSDGQDYLSQVDQESEDNNFNNVSVDDDEDEPIPSLNTPQNKPKVQVLNVRENRKEKKEPKNQISTEQVKIEAKKQINENINKVKDEFKEVEDAFEDTKEEINKIKEKVSEETQVVKAKIIAFGVQALEKLLTTPKNILMGIVFRKKKRPVEKEEKPRTDNIDISSANKKQIPKVKYAELLAQNIDFLTYDKKRFVEQHDTGALMEEIFMANVISDIKYCVRFVADLPSPAKGHYAGRKISEIFEDSTSEDINKFLYYALTNPESFKRNRFKFSEAYATWLIRKSHEM
ncbi:MAG: hypothetical protein U0354_09280 [Candidatus Sericytochromatia bacterium]